MALLMHHLGELNEAESGTPLNCRGNLLQISVPNGFAFFMCAHLSKHVAENQIFQ